MSFDEICRKKAIEGHINLFVQSVRDEQKKDIDTKVSILSKLFHHHWQWGKQS